ncbi:MAG: SDR family oxidoreductase [Vulcanimicrobiaceae bacterium]
MIRVLVTGATGYIGGRLVPRLVEAGHTVRVVARDSARLAGRFPEVEIVEGDLFDAASIRASLQDVDVAYYLVHSMMRGRGDFAENDRNAARIFAEAARDAGVKRIVYLGGLGVEDATLSRHLRSRHETGKVLRSTGVPVTEFRAAMIVGSGSASFEMMRYLTERLPVMIAPKWVDTPCQPISVRDVLAYLVAELDRPSHENAIFEIGGSDVLSYKTMMIAYARIRELRRKLIVVPFFTPRLSSGWIHLVTPIPASIARPLVDGLRNPVVVRDDRALREFPQIVPVGYELAVNRALDRYSTVGPETTWFGAFDVKALPGNFAGTTQGMLIDRRMRRTTATAHSLFRVFTSLGGTRGWLYADGLWEVRGILDRLVGGFGTRRGRRHATDLRVGDAVDFWRVEAYEPDRLLRLRAEMRLPGYAWLQFEIVNDDGATALQQTAFFDPRGAFGYLYWYSVLPFHELIFGNMARRIAQEAEALDAAPRATALTA